jgi:hypothetical protein
MPAVDRGALSRLHAFASSAGTPTWTDRPVVPTGMTRQMGGDAGAAAAARAPLHALPLPTRIRLGPTPSAGFLLLIRHVSIESPHA